MVFQSLAIAEALVGAVDRADALREVQSQGSDGLPRPAAVRSLQLLSFLLELVEHVSDTPMFGALSWRERDQCLKPPLDQRSRWQQHKEAISSPLCIVHLRGDISVLERIAP